VVRVVGDSVANAGPLYVGKDMSLPGVRAFVAVVQMHTFALADEDLWQARPHTASPSLLNCTPSHLWLCH
jgi:hypothetical protein